MLSAEVEETSVHTHYREGSLKPDGEGRVLTGVRVGRVMRVIRVMRIISEMRVSRDIRVIGVIRVVWVIRAIDSTRHLEWKCID